VTIPESVLTMRIAVFEGCTSLTNFAVDPLNPAYSSSPDGVLFDESQATLIAYPGAKTGTYVVPDSVTRIDDYAFYQRRGVTCVTIPERVIDIGYHSFIGCTGLTNFTVAPLNPTYSSRDGVLFDKLQDTLLIYPGGKAGPYLVPNSVTQLGANAFYNCTDLTSLTIPKSVTEIAIFGFKVETFYGCSSLTNITVDPFNTNYSSRDGVLFDKLQDRLLVYPGGKAGPYLVPNSVTQLWGNAFYNCAGLTSLTIPKSVTEIAIFGFKVETFYGCSSLTNITVDPFNTNYSSLDGVLFNKSQDTLLIFPGGKSGGYLVPASVTNIDAVAFADCTGLNNITVGKSVARIGSYAFRDCTGLARIYFTGDAPLVENAAGFDDNRLTIYYLPGTKGWGSTFAGRPAVLWNPTIQVDKASLGATPNGLGFNVVGTPNIPFVVETSTRLAGGTWVALQTFTLTNGLVSFTDPAWANSRARFYRIRSP